MNIEYDLVVSGMIISVKETLELSDKNDWNNEIDKKDTNSRVTEY